MACSRRLDFEWAAVDGLLPWEPVVTMFDALVAGTGGPSLEDVPDRKSGSINARATVNKGRQSMKAIGYVRGSTSEQATDGVT